MVSVPSDPSPPCRDVSVTAGVTPAGASRLTPPTALVASLHVALHFGWARAQDALLGLLADQLAAAGKWAAARVQAPALASLPSEALVQLLHRMAQRADGGLYTRPPISGVHDEPPLGGFTFTAADWASRAQRERCIASPWVRLGRLEWRLCVYPAGQGEGRGSHVSGERSTARTAGRSGLPPGSSCAMRAPSVCWDRLPSHN